MVNGAPALRVGDMGIHTACCNTNTWTVTKGSGKVIVNGQPLVRKGDPTQHCGGIGKMIEASGNVVDGSGDAEGLDLREQISEWLERVQADGIAELLFMARPALGLGYFAADGVNSLFSPECRGTDYFKHLAKCLPGKPPGWDEREPPRSQPKPAPGYHGPPDPGAQPVGLLDPTNPITDLVTLPFIAARGALAGVEGGAEAVPRLGRAAVDLAPKAGKWALHGLGDAASGLGGAASGLGHLASGLAGAL